MKKHIVVETVWKIHWYLAVGLAVLFWAVFALVALLYFFRQP
jgi:uncharacterized membrane protein YukC